MVCWSSYLPRSTILQHTTWHIHVALSEKWQQNAATVSHHCIDWVSNMLSHKAEPVYFIAAPGWHLLLKALALPSSFQG